jgi:hypothetical protein
MDLSLPLHEALTSDLLLRGKPDMHPRHGGSGRANTIDSRQMHSCRPLEEQNKDEEQERHRMRWPRHWCRGLQLGIVLEMWLPPCRAGTTEQSVFVSVLDDRTCSYSSRLPKQACMRIEIGVRTGMRLPRCSTTRWRLAASAHFDYVNSDANLSILRVWKRSRRSCTAQPRK